MFADDDPYMKKHLVDKPRRPGLASSSELQCDWTQGSSPTGEEGMQRFTSIRSLSDNVASMRNEGSADSRRNSSMTRGDWAPSGDRHTPQPPLAATSHTRSQRRMELGGRNSDSMDFEIAYEKSMSSIGGVGRKPNGIIQ